MAASSSRWPTRRLRTPATRATRRRSRCMFDLVRARAREGDVWSPSPRSAPAPTARRPTTSRSPPAVRDRRAVSRRYRVQAQRLPVVTRVRVYVATTNSGKLRELRAICARYGWDWPTFPGYRESDRGRDVLRRQRGAQSARLAAQLREANSRARRRRRLRHRDLRPRRTAGRVVGALRRTDATWPRRRAMLLANLPPAGCRPPRALRLRVHFVEPAGAETRRRHRRRTVAAEERGEAAFPTTRSFTTRRSETFGESSEGRRTRSATARARSRDPVLAAEQTTGM